MGYWFYGFVIIGMVFIFYLKIRSIAVSSMVLLIFMSLMRWSFPPEATHIYYGIVLFGITATLYGLFRGD